MRRIYWLRTSMKDSFTNLSIVSIDRDLSNEESNEKNLEKN